MRRRERSGGGGLLGLAGAAALVVSLAACDTEVINPGPIQDEFLNDPTAFPSVVQGVRRHGALALNDWAYRGGFASGEFVKSGNVGDQTADGHWTSGNSGGPWTSSHRYRWTAEDAIQRFREGMGEAFSSSEEAAVVLLHAGYANRFLGQYMCVAVIDQGPAQPHTAHFERAEDHFTEAISVANQAGRADLATAARAGRAAVRIWLDDWSGAVSDAAQVPDDFVHEMRYDPNTQEWGEYNVVYWRVANEPWRTYTVWGTFLEDYYLDSGDPRAEWVSFEDVPYGTVGQVPWYVQQKFTSTSDPINLSSGREMRLLEAEHALRQNDLGGALDLINGLRSGLVSDHSGEPLEPWTADTLEEGWTVLMRERFVELWGEARRYPDIRRWIRDGVPGELDVDVSDVSQCSPVGQSEIDTNPNDLPRVTEPETFGTN